MSSKKSESIWRIFAKKTVDSACSILKLPTISQLEAQVARQEFELQKKEAQERALYRVISKIRASLDLETIFRTTTKETCKLLRVERIAVYRFYENWGGEFVSDFEFVEPEVDDIKIMEKNTVWNDSYLQENKGGRYRNNEILSVSDIYTAGLSPCHLEILEQFQIRAYATAPIFIGKQLWGVLSAYQHSKPYDWKKSDIQFLGKVASQLGFAVQQAQLLIQAEQKVTALNQAYQRQKILFDLVAQIRESLNMESLFKTTVREIRKVLEVDRVGIFKFDPESNFGNGKFIAENVLPMYDSAIAVNIQDHCFGDKYAILYQEGRVQVIPNIYQAELKECYFKLLDQFQIKAQITVPLLEGNHLWGLLCVYQCSSPRSWTAVEIQFVQQLAAQFSVALKHSELLEQSCSQAEKLIQINHALEQANSKLEELSNIDTLTKIANRRCFDNYFAKEWQIHQEEQKPLAIIIIDIDYFKLYNDSYGHQEGDDCLMLVAQNIAKVTQRSIDLVARYGGEEFIAILPNTNTEGALTVAESMRKTIASLAIPHANSEVSQYLTLSLGIASLIPTAETYPENLIANADKALYVAKNQGRDRAMVYTV